MDEAKVGRFEGVLSRRVETGETLVVDLEAGSGWEDASPEWREANRRVLQQVRERNRLACDGSDESENDGGDPGRRGLMTEL